MQFRAAADIDETSADAQWGLARVFESQEKFLETIESLRKVVDFAPDNLEAKTKLANYYLLFNPPQVDDADKLLQEIYKKDRGYVEGVILEASIQSARNRPEQEIVATLRKAINIDKKRAESYLALSRFYMKVSKPEEAEKAIEEAIAANPKSAVAYVEYGRFLGFEGKSEESEAKYLKAVEIAPKDYEAGLALASHYIYSGQKEKAEQKFKSMAAAQGNSAEGRMDLGRYYQLSGRDDDALKVFDGILKETPDYARARYLTAEIYLGRKDLEKTKAEIEKLLSINDQDFEALLLSARLKLAEGKAEDAVSDIEEVLRKQPSHREGLYYMTQARIDMGQIDQARSFIGDLEKYHPSFRKTSLLKMQRSFAANAPEDVVKEADLLIFRVSNLFPADAFKSAELEQLRLNGFMSRGLARLQLGDVEGARTDLLAAEKMSPSLAAAKVNLAKTYIAEKNYDAAADYYSKALALDESDFDALSGLVSVLGRQGKFADAFARIDARIAKSKADNTALAALHFLKSEVFGNQGNAAASETELKEAIAADADYLPAYSAYASVLINKNQTDEALKQYQTVLQKKPSASIYTLIGILEDGRGKYDEAEKNYRKALEMNPESAIAANNLAWLIADTGKGNLDEAMKLAGDVVKANPKVSGYYDTLGWVYLKKGFNDQAVEQFKQAVALDSSEAQQSGRTINPGYRFRLGLALHSAGDKDAAKREVATALKEGSAQFSAQELKNAKLILGES